MVIAIALASVLTALPTERVMPEGRFPFVGNAAERIEVSLARNERESVQVVVDAEADLNGVKVGVEGIPLRVDCDMVAYSHTTNAASYTGGSVGRPAWYPDALAPVPKDGLRVRKGFRQSFWIRVYADVSAVPGTYAGTLRVQSSAGALKTIPFTVRVRNFTLPHEAFLPLAITFNPQTSLPRGSAMRKAVEDLPSSPLNLWRKKESEWYGFLADYGITPDNLYWNNVPGDPALADQDGRWAAFRRLRDAGRLGRFNLGYFAPLDGGETNEAAWRTRYLRHIRRAYDRALRDNILGHAYIYGCDEAGTNRADAVARACAVLKRELPGVPIMTTAKDARPDGGRAYGCGTPLAAADACVPLTDKYDPAQAVRARAEGREVWWYVCCWPHGDEANLFLESRPIEGRLLAGAMSVQSGADGFLYYQTSMWNSLKAVGRRPKTEWTAQSWECYNGDGSLARVAEDGSPLPTVRLENLRDGLEDYAYAKLYERKFGRMPEVPQDVANGTAQYDRKGTALLAWRERIAEALEREPPMHVKARFSGAKPDYRAMRDVPFRHDLTSYDGVRFDIGVGDLRQFSGFNFYYKAGDGWLSKGFEMRDERGTVFVSKDGGFKEGPFAGFDKVEAIRICGWRVGTNDTVMVIDNIRPYRLDEMGSAAMRKKRSQMRRLRENAYVATLPPGPPGEFRAFWCHSPNGMPGMTWDEAVKYLKDCGFNALLVNLAWGGWARFDKFDEVKAACRRHGVKMHVWKVCWHMWWGGPEDALGKIERDGRCALGANGSRERWMCPNDPENRKSEADLFVELAKRGPDGVHFDYIRYPDANRCFCDRCRKLFEARISRTVDGWPGAVRTDATLSKQWNEFRRETITSFVRDVSRRVRTEAPGVELSAAVVNNPVLSRDGVAQDWPVWCAEGLLDFVCPMDYVDSPKTFESLVDRQKSMVGNVRLYPGIGLSSDGAKLDTRTLRTAEQIVALRRQGVGGFVIFNFDRHAKETLDCLARGLTRPEADKRRADAVQ